MLGCYRYIELNPLRANMVNHPADYRWSSYRLNAQAEDNNLVTPHPLYMALDSDNEGRKSAYRELFRFALEPGLVDEISSATNGNYALGTTQFQDEFAAVLKRRVSPGKPGRPQTNRSAKNQDLFNKK